MAKSETCYSVMWHPSAMMGGELVNLGRTLKDAKRIAVVHCDTRFLPIDWEECTTHWSGWSEGGVYIVTRHDFGG